MTNEKNADRCAECGATKGLAVLPRLVQLVAVGDTVCALDAEGGAWALGPSRDWRRLAVFVL